MLIGQNKPVDVFVEERVVYGVSRLLKQIYVPTDFDTIEKAFSGVKTAEKGIKQGLSRSNADFGSPCLLYSVMDFCRSDVRWHRGV